MGRREERGNRGRKGEGEGEEKDWETLRKRGKEKNVGVRKANGHQENIAH